MWGVGLRFDPGRGMMPDARGAAGHRAANPTCYRNEHPKATAEAESIFPASQIPNFAGL